MALPESIPLPLPKVQLPMDDQNPYEPILSEPATPLKRIRWIRRFAVLNCVIFLIPVICAFAVYVDSEAKGFHFSGVSVTMGAELVVLLIAYVAIPNFIMFALWLRNRHSL